MTTHKLFPGIVSDPEIMGGRPIIKGHRITAEQIAGHIRADDSIEEVCDAYELTEAEIRAALDYIAAFGRE